jgi:hypothetical protein
VSGACADAQSMTSSDKASRFFANGASTMASTSCEVSIDSTVSERSAGAAQCGRNQRVSGGVVSSARTTSVSVAQSRGQSVPPTEREPQGLEPHRGDFTQRVELVHGVEQTPPRGARAKSRSLGNERRPAGAAPRGRAHAEVVALRARTELRPRPETELGDQRRERGPERREVGARELMVHRRQQRAQAHAMSRIFETSSPEFGNHPGGA